MKKITLIISLILLTSCGLITKEEKSFKIHPELAPYLQEFEYIYGKKIDDLDMRFAEDIYDGDGNETLGYCQKGVTYSNKLDKTIVKRTPKIVINRKTWEKFRYSSGGNFSAPMTEDDKKQLVFHELGHCILDKDHSKNKSDIMFASFQFPDYSKVWQGWIETLFNSQAAVMAFNEYAQGNLASTLENQDTEDLGIIQTEANDCVHDKGVEFEELEEHDHSHE